MERSKHRIEEKWEGAGKVKTLGCFHSYRVIRDKRNDNSVIIYSLISYDTHMNGFLPWNAKGDV